MAEPGEWPQPVAYWIGRLCEEFQCLPSEAYAEVQRLPVGMLEEIIEARAFASAFSLWRTHPELQPRSAMVETVIDIEMSLTKEDLDE